MIKMVINQCTASMGLHSTFGFLAKIHCFNISEAEHRGKKFFFSVMKN